jgi:hypothetical protein
MEMQFELSLGAAPDPTDPNATGADQFQFLTDPAKGATSFTLTGTNASGDLSSVLPSSVETGGSGTMSFAGATSGAPSIALPESDVVYSIATTAGAGGAPQQAVTFDLASAWNTIKNIDINSFDGASLTMKNWVDVNLNLTHAADGSADTLDHTIDIEGAKRGSVALGDGDQTLHVGLDSNGAIDSNTFNISAGNGDNTISVGDADHHYAATGLYFDPSVNATIPENLPAYDQSWSSVGVTVGNGANSVELDGVYAHANVTAGTGGTDLTVTDPGNHWNGIATTLTANLAGGANTVDMVDAYLHTNITTGNGADTIDIQQSTRGDAPAGQDISLNLGDGAKETDITGNFHSISYSAGNGDDSFTFNGHADVTVTAGAGQSNIIAGWGDADITLGSGAAKVEIGGIAGEQGGTYEIHAGTGQADFVLYQTDAAGHAATWQQATIDNFNLGSGDQLIGFGATKGAENALTWTAGSNGVERVGNDLDIHLDGSNNDSVVVLKSFFTLNAAHLSPDELAGALTNQSATEIMHQVLHDGFSDPGWADSQFGTPHDHVALTAATAHEFMGF